MEKKVRKGDLVRVNEARCFTTENGGMRRHPIVNWDCDERRILRARFIYTADDNQKWREEKRRASDEARARGEDTFSIHFDDAGESRLPGISGLVELKTGQVYEVLRARCRAHLNYGNPTPGMMKLLDTASGREVYVKRECMELV